MGLFGEGDGGRGREDSAVEDRWMCNNGRWSEGQNCFCTYVFDTLYSD